MSLKDLTKYYLDKIPNIVLIPVHSNIEIFPSYPLFGKREILCGPKLQNIDTGERKCIRTSGRFFDIDEVLSQLNENDRNIDLVVSVLQTSTTCFPKNLYKLDCPKIAIIADTHHLLYAISPIIQYIKRENYAHIIKASQPAHLHFFYEAGITHSAFYPPIALQFKNVKNKKNGVTFIGKRWSSPQLRRSRMVQFLEKKLSQHNIPFHHYDRLPYFKWLKVLSRSKMIVISSLNGQFTPQIHSCLFAGALCFIDELSSQTFLYQFFEPDKHLVTWSSFEDLLEKIIYYYNNPTEAEIIAKAGKFQAENNFPTSESFALTISKFVFENMIDPRMLAINDARSQQKRVESPEYFNARVRLYENIQELHRIHESLTLISLTEKNLNPLADLADLPRLKITNAFFSDNSKKIADLYFHRVGVNHQIETIIINKLHKSHLYNIGILEKQEDNIKWKMSIKLISKFLKKNSLLWILGNISTSDIEILSKEGFKLYVFKNNHITLKIKKLSRKVCYFFWKIGKFPFPYLTLKPAMGMAPHLNVFLRGWQGHFPQCY
ncbi:MAG: glycosyltransferase [Promethearchaeota archaeon]